MSTISARTTAVARTAVIRMLRFPTTAHHRTTPRHYRRVCTRLYTTPSTNCSWCKVVTSVVNTRNPSFPSSGVRRLFLSPRRLPYFLYLLLPFLSIYFNEEVEILHFLFRFLAPRWSQLICRALIEQVLFHFTRFVVNPFLANAAKTQHFFAYFIFI